MANEQKSQSPSNLDEWINPLKSESHGEKILSKIESISDTAFSFIGSIWKEIIREFFRRFLFVYESSIMNGMAFSCHP